MYLCHSANAEDTILAGGSAVKVWGGGMWKAFVAINGSECVRALTCIAIDDPLGGGRREDLSALTPDSKSPIYY